VLKLRLVSLGNVQAKTLNTEIVKNIKETVNLCTDEWVSYKGISRIYSHSVIKHNEGEYIRGRVHTNTIEGFWSLMKRGIVGIYHFTSKKYLQKYVDEFVFRYNSRELSESVRFNVLLGNTETRTTYKGLING